jgi:hypothetical protein
VEFFDIHYVFLVVMIMMGMVMVMVMVMVYDVYPGTLIFFGLEEMRCGDEYYVFFCIFIPGGKVKVEVEVKVEVKAKSW